MTTNIVGESKYSDTHTHTHTISPNVTTYLTIIDVQRGMLQWLCLSFGLLIIQDSCPKTVLSCPFILYLCSFVNDYCDKSRFIKIVHTIRFFGYPLKSINI